MSHAIRFSFSFRRWHVKTGSCACQWIYLLTSRADSSPLSLCHITIHLLLLTLFHFASPLLYSTSCNSLLHRQAVTVRDSYIVAGDPWPREQIGSHLHFRLSRLLDQEPPGYYTRCVPVFGGGRTLSYLLYSITLSPLLATITIPVPVGSDYGSRHTWPGPRWQRAACRWSGASSFSRLPSHSQLDTACIRASPASPCPARAPPSTLLSCPISVSCS